MSLDSSQKDEIGAIQAPKELSPYEFNLLTTLAIVATFLVLSVIGGYAFNWSWTGFQGNHLWDWLKLLLIPVVLAGATLFFSTDRKWRREWTVALYVIAALLLVSVVGGYVFNWSWTGFRGNTLWDWFNLVLQPFGLAALSIFFGSTAKWREEFVLVVAVVVVFLLVSFVGSYAFNWNWTGFQGNRLWEWINLLLLSVTLAVVSISFKGYERVWTVVIVAAAIFLLVAAVGGYVFNWSWTGFQGNYLWDWLKLLLLPVALVAVKPALNRYWKQSMAVIVAAMVFLVVSAVGGYTFNWSWTGFQGNHLWDWLKLLLLPIGLAAAQIWFSPSKSKESNTKMSKQELPDMSPGLAAHLADENTPASPQPSSPTGLPDSSTPVTEPAPPHPPSRQRRKLLRGTPPPSHVPPPPTPYLVRSDGAELRLESDMLNLGRAPDNHIVVNDKQVSRRHSVLKREGTSYVLEDAGTPNGTYVNGERIQRRILASGDVIRLGQTEFSYRLLIKNPASDR